MGNVLRALRKSAGQDVDSKKPAVHMVSLAVTSAEEAAKAALDAEAQKAKAQQEALAHEQQDAADRDETPASEQDVQAAEHEAIAAAEQAVRAELNAQVRQARQEALAAQGESPDAEDDFDETFEQEAEAGYVVPTAAAPSKCAPASSRGGSLDGRRSYYFGPLIPLHHQPRSKVSEQFRQVRTSLLRIANRGLVRCMITSAEPREGKTVTAANLAYCFSEISQKKTLLIDGDLRRGSVAELFGIDNRVGLANVLAGDCSPDQAIWTIGRNSFHVLPAGRTDLDMIGELLSGDRAEQMMKSILRGFDYVILDAPPAIGVADTGILGQWMDTTLLAMRIHKTPKTKLADATEAMESAGVNVVGMIALDESSTNPTSYGYDYGY